jgi:CRP-like cAMP-binding protein
MDLVSYINKYLPNKLDLEEKVNLVFRKEVHPKGKILLLPGRLSNKMIFIEKGLIRAYYVKDGKEITHLFFEENDFSAPIESIFYNKPSRYGWEVLNDTTIRVLNYIDFEQLLIDIEGMERFVRMIFINTLKLTSDRLYSLQFQTAEDRYKFMMQEHPNIILRAPLGHIASYLGITQQTLSVIRGKK